MESDVNSSLQISRAAPAALRYSARRWRIRVSGRRYEGMQFLYPAKAAVGSCARALPDKGENGGGMADIYPIPPFTHIKR
jgi:hypothetical protein